MQYGKIDDCLGQVSSQLDDSLEKQRQIVYAALKGFTRNRASWYRDESKINLKKLLSKDVVMFAARGVTTAHSFVDEAFHACESSSEETVMGNTWQTILTNISNNTLDTGDMMTYREGVLWICELKSQTNTVNSSSFPQELRELKSKVESQSHYRRANNSKVQAAFCVLRASKSIDDMRHAHYPSSDDPNHDLDGFAYRYLAGSAFWEWLAGVPSVEYLVEDASSIALDGVVEARAECMTRLHTEMSACLAKYELEDTINDVLKLKAKLLEESAG